MTAPVDGAALYPDFPLNQRRVSEGGVGFTEVRRVETYETRAGRRNTQALGVRG